MRIRWRQHETGGAPTRRHVRITYRCLYIDLHLDVPPAATDLGSIDHPIMAKARQFAAEYPANQIRIQAIRDTVVYRFTHGRDRVATWLDRETGVMWVCAVDERDDDTYDHFVGLHEAGELLPDERDSLREEVEAAAQFAAAVRDGVPQCIDEARRHPSKEHFFDFAPGVTIRLYVRPGDVDEVWIAMPTLDAPAGLMPRMRALVLATAEQHLGGECEQQYDWPTGQLRDYEIAYLGLA
jgi:hypothetical protein